MLLLIKNIKELLQVRPDNVRMVSGAEMAVLPTIKNAFLLLEGMLIKDFGPMSECPENQVDDIIDASGKIVLPAWCDCHTHLVYAGNRELEFVDRINGLTYEEIAARGGGIINSAKMLGETSEDEIFRQSSVRLLEVMKLGTGAVEIKSGYGLTVEGELKMLRVIKKLKQSFPLEIKATFLGAHAFPAAFKDNHDGYVNLIIKEMIPMIAEKNLAEFIDVFCETGYFSVAETEKIMTAGVLHGLIPKIHVNQFNALGGIDAAVRHNALSVDHLEVMRPEDILALKDSGTMPVALPSCSYFLSIPYTPARDLISAGLPLALATDYNPGSSPSGNMSIVVAAACIKMKMTPEEAINAATINGAYAMGLSDSHGSITKGKQANVIITREISSWYQIPYAFGSNLIETVLIKGKAIA